MDYRKHLTEDILPFWLDNAIDEEFGGIFTQLDGKGNIYGTEKSVWFQGRALYIFSFAHNCGVKDPRLLPAAKKIFDFLLVLVHLVLILQAGHPLNSACPF